MDWFMPSNARHHVNGYAGHVVHLLVIFRVDDVFLGNP